MDECLRLVRGGGSDDFVAGMAGWSEGTELVVEVGEDESLKS